MAGMPKSREFRTRMEDESFRNAVMERIARGEGQRSIAADLGTSPSILWRVLHAPAHLAAYEQAKEDCAEYLAEEILDIADSPPALTPLGSIDSADIAHKRLRIDTRKWVASKLKPKKYGDKIDVSGNITVNAITELAELATQRSQRLVDSSTIEGEYTTE